MFMAELWGGSASPGSGEDRSSCNNISPCWRCSREVQAAWRVLCLEYAKRIEMHIDGVLEIRKEELGLD